MTNLLATGLSCCPLCGNGSHITVLYHSATNTYNVSCGGDYDEDDGCGLGLFGGSKDTQEEIIKKWNTRK